MRNYPFVKFKVKRVSCYTVLIFCVFAYSPVYSQDTLSPVKIFGVTDGSVYTDFVKPRWYAEEFVTATVQKDSGIRVPFSNGQKISENGGYQLVVTKSVDGLTAETILNFVVDSSAGTAMILTNIGKEGTELKIMFSKGIYYKDARAPVMAIWTEDSSGNFLQNLYVSAVAGTNIMRYTDNYVRRPQALPYWTHKACLGKDYGWYGYLVARGYGHLFLADPSVPLPEDLDAVTGATQLNTVTLKTKARTSDTTDKQVRICFELNQPKDFGWYFNLGNTNHEEDGTGLLSDDIYFRRGTPGEPAIVYCGKIDLDKAQTYLLGGSDGQNEIMPIGYSHYAGRTGKLYTDFYYPDANGVERYKFDHAHKMVGSITVEVILR